MNFGHISHHTKLQIFKFLAEPCSMSQFFGSAPSRGKIIFVTNLINIGVKSSVLKIVIQEKNRIWKRPTLTWFIVKKLTKNGRFAKTSIFCLFFSNKSCQSGSFSKPIFFLNHNFQDTTFDTYSDGVCEKNDFASKGGRAKKWALRAGLCQKLEDLQFCMVTNMT